MRSSRYLNAITFLVMCTLYAACSHQNSTTTSTTSDQISNVNTAKLQSKPFLWQNANIYFMLTDRFNNGNPSNDQSFNRKHDGAVLRSYEGGDLAGITEKINEGYFQNLGVNAIWITPHIEQIKGFTNEGTGKTYAFHGYWAADWTAIDPNLGTAEDMRRFVDTAHENGIRVIFDVVINHTGPVTDIDPQWPEEWVRTEPQCTYTSRETTVTCTLVRNLPDIKTESNVSVSLPPQLAAKWKKEGRYAQEVKELDAFFSRTGLPRAPRYYIMKWHLDWIREYGVDGFRVDTVKHTEAELWREFEKLATAEFEQWKQNNPDKKLSDDQFYLTGEVYNYGIQAGTEFTMGPNDTENFFDDGFDSLINFSLRSDKERSYEEIFSEYSEILNTGPLAGYSVVNYLSSHDDGSPFDKQREKPFESATLLFLTPGAVQIYYGDEVARPLVVEGAEGDAHLRSMMDWQAFEDNSKRAGVKIQDIYEHWSKLGKFRAAHPAVGAGIHKKIAGVPYTFSRTLNKFGLQDKVVVAINESGDSPITVVKVDGVFNEGDTLVDSYSGNSYKVKDGKITLRKPADLVLLGL